MSDLEKVARALCRSGKFETGEGTCAFVCMDQLGDARKKECPHAAEVHGSLAEAVLKVLGWQP